jgi:peptidoglycan glycosyltransferase
MRLLLKRASVLLALALFLVFGLLFFMTKYFMNAPEWAGYPANKHLFSSGMPISSGSIYDRSGEILLQMSEGKVKFNPDKNMRTAVMHATGDMNGNVATGARIVFREKLGGWDFINGAYNFDRSNFGDDITLTLDADLCASAYKALKGQKGAVGVYNYRTGEILCMVSSPSFDPQNPPDVENNTEKYKGVYLNRLLSAVYAPGSVFKLVTSAAAIENIDGIEEKVYHCEGKLNIDGKQVTCPSAHGNVTLEKALAVSCNVAFAEITLELGADTLQEYADLGGFNSGLEVSGIRTAAGKVNVSEAEGADLAWAGIGQYTDTANPLNVMVYMGAIANKGVRITPKILGREGLVADIKAIAEGRKRIMQANTSEKLGKMMRNNVISNYGEANFKGLELCAKSGTAEVGGGLRPHSWFAGYLDRDDFPLAFVVVIENGGSGSKVAGAVAAKVLKEVVKR